MKDVILLTCPVCGKQFKYTEDCKYKLGKEYTCTWKCLLKHIRKTEKNKPKEVKRGRPRKNEII